MEFQGLTDKEVIENREKFGINEISSKSKFTNLKIFIGVMKDPMLFLLLISSIVYIVIGELKDALLLFIFAVIIILIIYLQERKSEKALLALRKIASPRCSVIRNGNIQKIAGRDVVMNDLIILNEGDRISADCHVLQTQNLLCNESLLTGESLPILKQEINQDINNKSNIINANSIVYRGSIVIQGYAIVRAFGIGLNSKIGKIGKSLSVIKDEPSILKKETKKIIKIFGSVAFIICMIVFLFSGLIYKDWSSAILSGIALGMALLPEEFSVVLTIFTTLGTFRIAKKKVLVRKAAAIETLGAISVLCVDKTGTLTMNEMKLKVLMVGNKIIYINSPINFQDDFFTDLLESAHLASNSKRFDPIDNEIINNTKQFKHDKYLKVKEFPFQKDNPVMANVYKINSEYNIYLKGAPETIMNLCKVSNSEFNDIDKSIKKITENGFRLIGIARSKNSEIPKNLENLKIEFVGILGFNDPIRKETKASIQECLKAGISVKMITGDHIGTAKSIADQIGLGNKEILTGSEISKMSDDKLREKLLNVDVFARVGPEEKLKIVRNLKYLGFVVGMSGDGVNDCLALSTADVGISMGLRGTDVAREASDIVLLDDNFASIVNAIRLGRRIYDNLKKSMIYIIATHIPIAGLAVIPVMFDLPLILLPTHIALLELIIDPACSIVFESQKEEKNIMNRSPKKLNSSLFSSRTLIYSSILGIVLFIGVFSAYLLGMTSGLNEAEIRTFSFMTLIFCNYLIIISSLSWKENFTTNLFTKNKALYLLTIILTIVYPLIFSIPFLQNIFSLSSLKFEFVLYSVLISLGTLLILEIIKITKLKTNIN